MITGYPSLQNAVECANKHADAFFMKSVDYEKLITNQKVDPRTTGIAGASATGKS
jgi:hypothetical protein